MSDLPTNEASSVTPGNHEAPSVLHHAPVKALVNASLVAYARLFRFERDRQRSVTLLDDRVTGTFIMTRELCTLQSALADLLGGLDTFTGLAIAKIAAQDKELLLAGRDGGR